MTENLQTRGTYDGEIAVDDPGRGGAELAYYAIHRRRASGDPQMETERRDAARTAKAGERYTRPGLYRLYIYPLRVYFSLLEVNTVSITKNKEKWRKRAIYRDNSQ